MLNRNNWRESFSNKQKIIVLIILLILIAVTIYLYNGFKHNQLPPKSPIIDVSVLVVKQFDLPFVFKTPGETKSSKEVEIRPRVSGVLEKILYNEGTFVSEGTPLFQIQKDTYSLALQIADAALSKATALYKQAVRDKDRFQNLFDKNFASQKDLDDAISQKDLTNADIETAKAQIAEAKLNLDYTNIIAPIGGMISKASLKEGSFVNSEKDIILTKIVQVDPIYVDFSVSEADYTKSNNGFVSMLLNPKTADNVVVDMYYGEGIKFNYSGILNFTEVEFNQEQGAIGMRASFPNPQFNIMGGQFVRLTIKGGRSDKSYILPKKAIMESSSGKYVFRVNDEGLIEKKDIKEGNKFGDLVEIISGLESDDKIVIEGLMNLAPGAKVNITHSEDQDINTKTLDLATINEIDKSKYLEMVG